MPPTLTDDDRETVLQCVEHERRLAALLRRALRAVEPKHRGMMDSAARESMDGARLLLRHADGDKLTRRVVPLGLMKPQHALGQARDLTEHLAALYDRLEERLTRSGAKSAAKFVGILAQGRRDLRERLGGTPPSGSPETTMGSLENAFLDLSSAVESYVAQCVAEAVSKLRLQERPSPKPSDPMLVRTAPSPPSQRRSVATEIDRVLSEAKKPLSRAEIAKLSGRPSSSIGNALQWGRKKHGWVCTGTRGAARWTKTKS